MTPWVFPTVQANEYGITPVAGSIAALAASGSLRGERRMILSPAEVSLLVLKVKFYEN